ncbi:MAG: sigma-70 family RNA polymerase sigma factor [Myxococcales bacterium]|jgi:RNA polymerase sigma-70 factor (ECF subfamily)|nr:sigma-70 family RNA polymerase sigma factor [Myxococcales bacterium]
MFFFALPDLDLAWLDRFHAGERGVLEACYREHVGGVLAKATRILRGVDAETVTHEVFYRLLSDEKTRRGFTGGSFGSWIGRVATNAAIDHHRRRRREVEGDADTLDADPARFDEEVEAKMLVERFRREKLPEKWAGVFDARFLRQLPQREAAAELGMQRSTLAYQEEQIRALLTAFLLDEEDE